MKKIYLMAVAALMSVAAWAQNIAVVSPSNSTTIFQTLGDAITGAIPGSTIYLPGGGFQISDETLIDKKLTIMGVSHRADTDNVDGATIISGNLNFVGESSGSAVIGVYITGNINIGTDADPVLNFTVRYCNVNSIQVKNSQSSGMVINQCYIRSTSNFGGSNAHVTNNILHSMRDMVSGVVFNNLILAAYTYHSGSVYMGGGYSDVANIGANTTIIKYNIFNSDVPYSTSQGYGGHTFVYGSDNQCSSNLTLNKSFGENCIVLEDTEWNDVFVNYNNGAISPASNFHFKGDYQVYENQVGIYSGSTPFHDDKSLAPIPRIVSKEVAEQTDGSGKLKVQLKVKAQ